MRNIIQAYSSFAAFLLKTNLKTGLFVILLPFLVSFSVQAQSDDGPDVTLESPYNTIYAHLYYLQPDSYRPALAAKTLYGIADSTKAVKAAIKLKQILDGKGLYVQPNLLPQEPNYIDSLTEKPFYTPFPNELPEVFLEKIDDKWYYSKLSVDQIPVLHKSVYPFGADLLLKIMPRFGHNKILGLAIWQYLGILILLLLAFIAHFMLSRILSPVVRRLSRSKLYPSLISTDLIWKIARYVSLFFIVRLIGLFLPALQLPIAASSFGVTTIKVVSTILIVIIALRILDIIMLYATRATTKTENKLDEQLMPIVTRILQAMIIIGGIIQILRMLDVNVTALIAGVSIGGLALALAAQDTVKNLIGSAMIFIDRPFQIGDYIQGGGVEGTVVEVGFRTTRIKQIDSSIIAVPNGNIANMAITNLGVREFRLLNMNLGLTYDTSPEAIEQFIVALKELIESHPKTLKEGYYVHLKNLSDSSLDIMFRVYLKVEDYATELITKEELMLSILRLAEQKGVSFAFPSTSVYIEKN
jgi:MscS family membrane protein